MPLLKEMLKVIVLEVLLHFHYHRKYSKYEIWRNSLYISISLTPQRKTSTLMDRHLDGRPPDKSLRI